MARQADEADLVGQVPSAELGAQTGGPGRVHHAALPLGIAEGGAGAPAAAGQTVEIAGRGQLDRFEGHLRREAADDDGDAVGRAGGHAQGGDLLGQESRQRALVQESLGFLEKGRLVGGSAALGQEKEFILLALGRGDVDLGREVVPGVHLVEDRQRGHL